MTQKLIRVTVAGKSYEVLVDVIDENYSSSEQTSRTSQVVPVGGTTQSAAVRSELTQAGSQWAVPSASSSALPEGPPHETGLILSPLAGMVVSVQCGLGDVVGPEDPVVVIEAMKMETIVYAGFSGKVEQIFIKTGDQVSEGQPLVRVS